MYFFPFVECAAVGLGTLRKVAKSKVQYVPTLGTVIPYLELSAKQEYLVQRIKGNQNAWCTLCFILLNGVQLLGCFNRFQQKNQLLISLESNSSVIG